MKLSSHQALVLFTVLGDTLKIGGLPGAFDDEQRLKLYNEILRQQDLTVMELEAKSGTN